ncbi:4'-phosphopantetheinyl transferase superfamily protein [Cylindrospermopsis raciborskii LB2897]|uniref:4'-phosphopantetheinyl transferase family protein n=1 Tax=Cylindrospermopsis raciborskii TaxID=77022 RepID=UPI001454C536|nr:4'-phosphopantetheinyl transferase superfamily protein [Cylindrospermopsis raciborskii]MBG0742076.1 4'-phosphopantetheinyl transferase superfamily protein [Cylindrospermopsis raciborskii KL1]NLQ07077.1 4'-phosphopantetheinyl transferase superfamily protein [Cylindrospermopsis raciborskii LB2897]
MNQSIVWQRAPENFQLCAQEVHIWKINLKVSPSEVELCRRILSGDEIARAERFYFPEHQERFIVGRAFLRKILSRYLNVEAKAIEFEYEERGKPLLGFKFKYSGICFNLSHSQQLALCGVTHHIPIGVDIESIRHTSDIENLAKRFFSVREYEVIKSVPPEQQQQVFFRYWTCKEAYLKAIGKGLSELSQVEIELTPNKSARLRVLEDWQLKELVPANNFAAAVVIASHNYLDRFEFWEP